jgi:hypothetical protein
MLLMEIQIAKRIFDPSKEWNLRIRGWHGSNIQPGRMNPQILCPEMGRWVDNQRNVGRM